MNSNDGSLMDRTGLGLLPGLLVALLVVLCAMLALLLESVWVVALLVAAILLATGGIVLVVMALAGEDEDAGELRSKVPGLEPRDEEPRIGLG